MEAETNADVMEVALESPPLMKGEQCVDIMVRDHSSTPKNCSRSVRTMHARRTRRPLSRRFSGKSVAPCSCNHSATVALFRIYNAVRRHSTIGCLSPVEFERKVGFA